MSQSTELTGGAGFTFEDAAVAVYLATLLGEETAPGLPGRVVVRVASQQAAFGQPLDDLVVEGRSSDDVPAHLSPQVKRSIVVSAAASNADFREVVSRACETVKDDGFRERVDRVGLVTGTMADDAKRCRREGGGIG